MTPKLLASPLGTWDAERVAWCRCGAEFTQRKLPAPWLASLRASARETVLRECPAGWVPLNCPPCEHVALGADARLAGGFNVARRDVDDRRYEAVERLAMADA